MRVDTLAKTIAADILAERRTVTFPGCFMCGRTYSKGVLTVDGSQQTRFCSTLCRGGFDAGLPQYGERPPPYSLPQSGDGFRIECKGCRKLFVSRGLRCCSPECARSYREKLDIKATMAEVGMEPMREKRKCEHCGAISMAQGQDGTQQYALLLAIVPRQGKQQNASSNGLETRIKPALLMAV